MEVEPSRWLDKPLISKKDVRVLACQAPSRIPPQYLEKKKLKGIRNVIQA
jgi:hypothetical protein